METRCKVPEEFIGNNLGRVMVFSLATASGNKPFIRDVFGYYHNESIYIMTYLSSNKVQQIIENENIGLSCCGVFYANGVAYINESVDINDKYYDELKRCFSGVVNQIDLYYSDKRKCIICIHLKEGIVIEDEKEYEFKFN